jgi:hypothetical protein
MDGPMFLRTEQEDIEMFCSSSGDNFPAFIISRSIMNFGMAGAPKTAWAKDCDH